MRKIKFRAWDKINKCWYRPIHKAYEGNLFEMMISMGGDLLFHKINTVEHESLDKYKDRFVLMQYTGLLDKNGKEIYYGDILECGNENNFNWYVSDKFYYPILCECKGDLCRTDVMKDRPEHYEIIGNRFENPELLQ